VILVRDLARSFGAKVAVAGVSFEARDGEITGLLGPNGAGKTTTLRMLTTLMRPDRGSIHVDGIDAVADPLAVRRRLGVMPDGRGIYQRLTARENIEYFGRLQGVARDLIRARADAWIRDLGMEAISERRTIGFSQGERAKTALARAMVHDPGNVILDEPANGLDVMTTRNLREMLRRLRGEGRCVLLSSHIMQEVTALCDRVVVVSQGRVVAQGTPDELLAHAGTTDLEEAFVRIVDAADPAGASAEASAGASAEASAGASAGGSP
jgi:sodium transport system ATP-binding protein